MPKGQNMRSVKYANFLAVLKAIVELGPIARVDLAEATGLTRTTVSNVTSDLIRLNLVREVMKGSASRSGGRKPILLQGVPDALFAVGIDIRKEKVSTILTDMTLRPLNWRSTQVPSHLSRDEGVQLLFQCVDEVMTGVDKKRIVGIGIGSVGPVDIYSGSVVSYTPLPWCGFSLRETVWRHYGLPVYLDVGSNMAAYGEVSVQPSLAGKTVIYITLGTGVGAGLVLSGNIHQAGPINGFGHSSINWEGPECECGNRGCLEGYVSTPAMVERFLVLKRDKGGDASTSTVATVEDLLRKASEEDPLAHHVLEETASILGIALTGLANTLGPDVIIMGGSVPGIGEAFAPLVRDILLQRLGRVPRIDVSVIPAQLGDKSIPLGAAGFCFGRLLESQAAFARVVSNLETREALS